MIPASAVKLGTQMSKYVGMAKLGAYLVGVEDDRALKAQEREATRRHIEYEDQVRRQNMSGALPISYPPPTMGGITLGEQTHHHYHSEQTEKPQAEKPSALGGVLGTFLKLAVPAAIGAGAMYFASDDTDTSGDLLLKTGQPVQEATE